jgi:hypothetical protein
MTSTYQHRALTSENEVKNITTMNALALMVFLLLFLTSTIAHAQHLAVDSGIVEQQECHICYHNIDTPPEFPEIQPLASSHYFISINKDTVTFFKTSNFVQPPLRAPPII